MPSRREHGPSHTKDGAFFGWQITLPYFRQGKVKLAFPVQQKQPLSRRKLMYHAARLPGFLLIEEALNRIAMHNTF